MYVVGSTVRKDQIFYEGHKKLKKSPTLLTQLSNFKKRWETSFSNFVAFSQYLNFKLDSTWCSLGLFQRQYTFEVKSHF